MANKSTPSRVARPARTRARPLKALSIAGLTTDEDVKWLATHAAGRKVIVEIGPFKGRSTRALADANKSGVVYSIDNWNSACGDVRFDAATRVAFSYNCADLIDADRVIPVDWDSSRGVPPELKGVSVDMLWIDGDHSFEAVASDIRNFAPLVRPGGLICGHDYCVWHPEVMQAVDEAYGALVRTIDIHRSIWWVA